MSATSRILRRLELSLRWKVRGITIRWSLLLEDWMRGRNFMMRRRLRRLLFKSKKRKKVNCRRLLSLNPHRNRRKSQLQLLLSQNSHLNRLSRHLQNLCLRLLRQSQRNHQNLSPKRPNLNQPLSLHLLNKTRLKLHLDSLLKSPNSQH